MSTKLTRARIDLRQVIKSIGFNGQAGSGAVGAVTVFTVTGEIEIARIVPLCTTSLTEAAPGGATISLGVTGRPTLLIAATTVLDVDQGAFWVNATPQFNGIALPATVKEVVITDNIIATIANAAVDSGAIRFTLIWRPISADGSVS